MHEHFKPQQWALAFGDTEDRPGTQLFTCPRCSSLRGNLSAWLASVRECPRCRRALDAYEPLPAEALECSQCMATYEVFEEWLEKVEHFEPQVAPEWITGRDLLEELIPLSLEDQLARVRDQLVYKQWGLCQRLLADSAEARLTDHRRSHDRAALAAAVADLLDEEEYHPQWTAELRANAHAYFANALRLLGDYRAAEQEFAIAEGWVEQGLGQGSAASTVLSLKASLLLDEYRHLEAEALLEQVERYHRERGEHVATAKTLLKLAMVSHARETPEEAGRRASMALEIFEQKGQDSLAMIARHNLVGFLLDSRDLGRARSIFDQISPSNDRLLRLRQLWLEGDLLRAEGDLDGAARCYDDVRVGYLAEDLHYNVALASLHLAMVAAAQDRHRAVRELARDSVVLLTRAGAPQEAFAAIRLLIDSIERQAVSVAFIQRVTRELTRLHPSE